ncbi:MAG: winged helix-turn-helix domain-containing protein [Sporichthyaceae bacterium]|nr:winged helix-turn-helix domain-containing protein [Sporichthyaceae bacterium]
MEFQILGPLEVVSDGRRLPLDRRQLRLLLAVLLCHAGQPVSPERLIEALWGTDPPPSATSNLHVYVHRLRKVLGSERIIGRGGAGYTLATQPGELDAQRFVEFGADGQAALAAGDVVRADRRLREALALWRGDPLSDLDGEPALREEIARLVEHRLIFLEHRIDADLGLWRHSDLIPELTALAGEYPYRERFSWQLMLALYRAGRQADALAVYRAARKVLADELGLEPGPALRELEKAILSGDPSLDPPDHPAASLTPAVAVAGDDRVVGASRPAQLPASIADFTGRETELKRLDELVENGTPEGMPITVITGTAGVGKTALAVHWAHHVVELFPDAQLYVNLRGYDRGEPIPPLRALSGFLAALGIPTDRIPTDTDEAASLYRSVVSGKRIMVVLDNAGSAEQVRPLLPGTRSCLVLITSRDRLAGLVARDGARTLPLGMMPSDEAVDLLARVIGSERIFHELSATIELTAACGGLPLALRISAANLADQPHRSIAEHLGELVGGDRLAALEIDGDADTAVRGAFDLSYARLTDETRRAFRLLGLVPGPDFTAEAAGAVLDLPDAAAGRLLARLADAHLIERPMAARFTFHDLFRDYARARAADEDGPAECSAAVARLYDYYLYQADAAARRLYPTILRLALPGGPRGEFADHESAFGWLTSEQHNLISAALRAQDLGLDHMAWLFADALRVFFWLTRNSVEWPAVAAAAVDASRQHGGLRERAIALFSLGVAHMCSAGYRMSIQAYLEALPLVREAGWADAEAACLANLGMLHLELGENRLAGQEFESVIELYQELDMPAQEALHLSSLASVHLRAGKLEQAASYAAASDAKFAEIDVPAIQVVAQVVGLEIARHRGSFADALANVERTVEQADHVGRSDAKAAALCQQSLILLYTGQLAEAQQKAQAAHESGGHVSDRGLEAELLNVLGYVDVGLGRYEPAVGNFLTALAVAREPGIRYTEIDAGIGMAIAYRRLGRLDAALSYGRGALDAAVEVGYRLFEGRARSALADILQAAGDPVAKDQARQALRIHRECGYRLGEAQTLALLGQLSTGAQARQYRLAAIEVFAELGTPEAAELRALTAR